MCPTESLNKYASLEQQFKVLRERYSEELGQKDAEIFGLKARLEVGHHFLSDFFSSSPLKW